MNKIIKTIKTNPILKWGLIIFLFTGLAAYIYKKITNKKTTNLFKTEKLQKRAISQVINATGKLDAQGTINIGSLINGIVEALYVEENASVKKGQILAKIDDGRGDTGVKQATAALQNAKVNLTYQTQFYNRQKKLYDAHLISQDDFDNTQRVYDSAIANKQQQQAYYEQELLQFNNKKIISPIDGIVIKKNVSLREGVANFSPPTILYTLAEDVRKMNVELEIDETDIGLIKIGQEAKLYFDTYPYKSFRGKINEISTGPIVNGGAVNYKAKIKIDNSNLLLKQGMTVHARIVVGSRPNTLALPGYIFSIDKKLIEIVAKTEKYGYEPLSKEERKKFKPKNPDNPVKRIWTFKNNTFKQKPIEIGISDNAFFEIVSGLSGHENIVVDVDEPDAMAEMYKRLFGGGLGGKK
ncbi:efflux RND transporter periplasmic adaptor subunit [bacterium]|nr:efflux RND transporter periplasmic adaptor subunit [bacterium]